MAKQKGLIRLRGKIGNLIFYTNIFGDHVRQCAAGPLNYKSKETRKRSKQNRGKFGQISTIGGKLREGIRPLIKQAYDTTHVMRMIKLLTVLISNEDSTGLKNIKEWDLKGLEGFNFNKESPLNRIFHVNFEVDYHPNTGKVNFSLESFIPTELIDAPKHTTHFRLIGGSKVFNLKGKSIVDINRSDWVAYDDKECRGLELTTMLKTRLNFPIIVLLGLEFCEEYNGNKGILLNKKYSSLEIVKVVTGD